MPWRQVTRHIFNTLTGITLFGLIVGVLSRGKPTWDSRFGLIVFMQCRILWPKSAAMTFGDVVVVRHSRWRVLTDVPEPLLRHEAEHARQYPFVLGLPYFPLYWAACLYSLARSRNYWQHNIFEIKAGLQNGGYL